MFQSGISIASLIISIATFIIAFSVQLYYFFGNRKKLEAVRNFFTKKRDYEVYGEAEDSQLNTYVAEEGSNLHTLIKELNEYTKKITAPQIFRSFKIRLNVRSMSYTTMLLQELLSRPMWALWVLLSVFSLDFCSLLSVSVLRRTVRVLRMKLSEILSPAFSSQCQPALLVCFLLPLLIISQLKLKGLFVKIKTTSSSLFRMNLCPLLVSAWLPL